MLKTLSALLFSALVALFFSSLEFAERVEAGELVTPQPSGRLQVLVLDKDCNLQTWPDYSASCLTGGSAKRETRRVGTNRG